MTPDASLVAVIGDGLLDVVVRRTVRAAPGADTEAAITLGPGGQAANRSSKAATISAKPTSPTTTANALPGAKQVW